MELLLTGKVNVPSAGKGVVAGVQVANGKYLIEGFIETPDSDIGSVEEHIYGHSLEVHYRLMGGVSLLGVWSTVEEDVTAIKVFKRLRKEGIVNTDIVSILFYDDKSSKAKRIKDSGDVQKVDFHMSGRDRKSAKAAFFNDKYSSEQVGTTIIQLMQKQLQHIVVSINDKFGDAGEQIFPKTLKVIPQTLPMKVFLGCGEKTTTTCANKAVTVHVNVAGFCLLTARSTFGDMTEAIRSDLTKSFSKRVDIVLDELTLELENEPDQSTLMSTSNLPRRVMYPLEGTSLISLYGTDQTRPADELDFIFSTPESTKLFQYPEGEIVDQGTDEDVIIEDIPTVKQAKNNYYLYAVFILIMAVLISIILSHLATSQ